MTTEACHIVEELLADEGLEALRDKPAALAHLRGCSNCRALLLALQELDGQLATLPAIEPSADLIGRALQAAGATAAAPEPPKPEGPASSPPAEPEAAHPPAAAAQTAPTPAAPPKTAAAKAAATKRRAAIPAPTGPVHRAQPAGRPGQPRKPGGVKPNPTRARRNRTARWVAGGALVCVALMAVVLGTMTLSKGPMSSDNEAVQTEMTEVAFAPPEPYRGSGGGGRYGGDYAQVPAGTPSAVTTPLDPNRPMGGQEQIAAGQPEPEELGRLSDRGGEIAAGEGQEVSGSTRTTTGLPPTARPSRQPDRGEDNGIGDELLLDLSTTEAREPRVGHAEGLAIVGGLDQEGRGLEAPPPPQQPVSVAAPGNAGPVDRSANERDWRDPYEDTPNLDNDFGRDELAHAEVVEILREEEEAEAAQHRTLDGTLRSERERELGAETRRNQGLAEQQAQGFRSDDRGTDSPDWHASIDRLSTVNIEAVELPQSTITDGDGVLGTFENGEWEPDVSFQTPPAGARGRVGWWARSVSEAEAEALLDRWDTMEGLVFQQPTGYWANTYVPGDPAIRELQQHLVRAETDASLTSFGGPSGRSLAEATQTYAQPFDPPRGSALAVYLATDRQGVTGPTRVLLEVGLQGTTRQTGRRPAMQVAVVLDLTQAPRPQAAAALEALLAAMADSRDIGDGFSLFVAGQPGGQVIPPTSFRYGPVNLAARQLLMGEAGPRLGDSSITYGLREALAAAAEQLGASNDPDSPLGTSAILLVTADSLGLDELADLEAIAHTSAVAGIPVSAVGVGPDADAYQLERIALAGQGNRRLVASADEAEDAVRRELISASRAVARAVRLRIRLAPGVQLVDILGSHRLDEASAERVREAEQSIDQRLSRSLGIQADRGEDEEGIQIVIPAFYAEDSHVILLDLVVPGPGAVADVTVRYKDLVFSRNGIARDSLALPRGEGERGPLELTVYKNRIAYEVSSALRTASAALWEGDSTAALNAIGNTLNLVSGLGDVIPELAGDREIEADVLLLSAYAYAIDEAMTTGKPAGDLANSLMYASYLKYLPPPAIE